MFTFPLGLFGSNTATTGSWFNWDGSADGINYAKSTVSGTRPPSVVCLDSTTFLEVNANSAQLNAYIGTVSGNVISYGAVTSGTVASGDINIINLVVLSATKVLVLWGESSNAATAMIVTISGTTVTFGSTFGIRSQVYVNSSQQLTKKDSSTVIFAYHNFNSEKLCATVLSISGTTITVGVEGILVSGVSNDSKLNPSVVYYDTDKILMFYRDNSSGYPTCLIFNISGTSIGTVGSPVTIESNTMENAISATLGFMAVVTSSSVILLYCIGSGTNTLRSVILSLSGNTVSTNSIISVVGATAFLYPMWIERLDNTEYMANYTTGNTSPVSCYCQVLTVSGNSIVGTTSVLIQNNQDAGGHSVALPLSRMDADTVINAVDLFGTLQPNAKVIKRS
jgi:hypothetical protein